MRCGNTRFGPGIVGRITASTSDGRQESRLCLPRKSPRHSKSCPKASILCEPLLASYEGQRRVLRDQLESHAVRTRFEETLWPGIIPSCLYDDGSFRYCSEWLLLQQDRLVPVINSHGKTPKPPSDAQFSARIEQPTANQLQGQTPPFDSPAASIASTNGGLSLPSEM